MTAAKNEVFIGLYHESCYLVLGDKNFMGRIFSGGEKWTNFQLVGGLPTIPSVGKTMHAAIYFYSWEYQVSIYKTNNLQKEKGFPRAVQMMEF